MDEITHGQQELDKRRARHKRETGSANLTTVAGMMNKSSPDLPANNSKPSPDGKTEYAMPPMPPAPVKCEFCGAVREPIKHELAGRTRYAPVPHPCQCAGAQAARTAEQQERQRQNRQQQAQSILLDASLSSGKWGRMTIDNWDVNRNKPTSQQALEVVNAYAARVKPDGQNWLYLHGPYGVGKTHLAVATLHTLAVTLLWRPRVVVWPEHCSAVQASWDNKGGVTEGQLWARMRNAKVLLVDDLDKRNPTAWALGKLYEVIEYRYRNEKPTLFTANRSLDDLADAWGTVWLGQKREWEALQIRDAGGAVLSRIAGQLWGAVPMNGNDQRWT